MGTIYQRKDGFWVASVQFGGRKLVKYAHTESEARRKLQELEL